MGAARIAFRVYGLEALEGRVVDAVYSSWPRLGRVAPGRGDVARCSRCHSAGGMWRRSLGASGDLFITWRKELLFTEGPIVRPDRCALSSADFLAHRERGVAQAPSPTRGSLHSKAFTSPAHDSRMCNQAWVFNVETEFSKRFSYLHVAGYLSFTSYHHSIHHNSQPIIVQVGQTPERLAKSKQSLNFDSLSIPSQPGFKWCAVSYDREQPFMTDLSDHWWLLKLVQYPRRVRNAWYLRDETARWIGSS